LFGGLKRATGGQPVPLMSLGRFLSGGARGRDGAATAQAAARTGEPSDGWGEAELSRLGHARLEVSPLCRSYWDEVARRVGGGRTGGECARRVAAQDAEHSPSAQRKRRRRAEPAAARGSPAARGPSAALGPLIVLSSEADGAESPPIRFASPWRIEECSDADDDGDDGDGEGCGVLRPLDAEWRSHISGYVRASKVRQLRDARPDPACSRRDAQAQARARARAVRDAGAESMGSLLEAVRAAGARSDRSGLAWGSDDAGGWSDSDALDSPDE
jgi:hypothetical protein